MSSNFCRITALISVLVIVLYAIPVVFGQSQASDPPPYKTYLPLTLKDYDPSWQWQPLQQITLSPTPFDDPVSVIDSQGRLHIFWDAWYGEK